MKYIKITMNQEVFEESLKSARWERYQGKMV
jgi:hypothetical protein